MREEAPAVRDSDAIRVLRCEGCGLLFLSTFAHAGDEFYADSGMYEGVFDLNASRQETAADDDRRVARLGETMVARRVLDVGCGNGGFLLRARKLASHVAGVDPHRDLSPSFARDNLTLFHHLGSVESTYEVITLFHVLEHVPDPRAMLANLRRVAASDAEVIIEVPNANDALLRLYRCDAFARFTYWSCHLFSFDAATLERLCLQAGARVVELDHVQRYSLANHLHWLAHGEPGGHLAWSSLDSPALSTEYERSLRSLRMTDTLWARVTFAPR